MAYGFAKGLDRFHRTCPAGRKSPSNGADDGADKDRGGEEAGLNPRCPVLDDANAGRNQAREAQQQ